MRGDFYVRDFFGAPFAPRQADDHRIVPHVIGHGRRFQLIGAGGQLNLGRLLPAPDLRPLWTLHRDVIFYSDGQVDGAFLFVVTDAKTPLEIAFAILVEAKFRRAFEVEKKGVRDHLFRPVRKVPVNGDAFDRYGQSQGPVARIRCRYGSQQDYPCQENLPVP